MTKDTLHLMRHCDLIELWPHVELRLDLGSTARIARLSSSPPLWSCVKVCLKCLACDHHLRTLPPPEPFAWRSAPSLAPPPRTPSAYCFLRSDISRHAVTCPRRSACLTASTCSLDPPVRLRRFNLFSSSCAARSCRSLRCARCRLCRCVYALLDSARAASSTARWLSTNATSVAPPLSDRCASMSVLCRNLLCSTPSEARSATLPRSAAALAAVAVVVVVSAA
mmetsp:Transcript_22041/g.49725  ORF Transcript_22041/g.49725 Transcript_22041/m.49725 type:complete len:224 (+) Transcript_22041:1076-1747(+)